LTGALRKENNVLPGAARGIPRSLNMDKYKCTVCDWVYDPAVGDPTQGVKPGTKFEDLPDTWICPECGVGKDQFEKV